MLKIALLQEETEEVQEISQITTSFSLVKPPNIGHKRELVRLSYCVHSCLVRSLQIFKIQTARSDEARPRRKVEDVKSEV
jgi:hypothetical protein